MELLANRNVNDYNTRNRDMLRLPLQPKIGVNRTESVLSLSGIV